MTRQFARKSIAVALTTAALAFAITPVRAAGQFSHGWPLNADSWEAQMVPSAFGQEGSAVQKEVWKGEEAYWRLLKEKNLEAFMSLWHEQFVGWPTGMSTPADKAAIRTRWYPSLTIENSIISYDLKPMGIRVHGDTAVVYSSVKLTTRNKQSNEREGTFFLTHTWMKENAKWQIVGGMARRPADDDKP